MAVIESGDKYEIVEEEHEYIYKIKFPELSDKQKEIQKQVLDSAVRELDVDFSNKSQAELREEITSVIKELLLTNLKSQAPDEVPDDPTLTMMADTVTSEMVGFGPLDPLLADDSLEEVMVIGFTTPEQYRPVYVAHRKFGAMASNVEFKNDEDINKIIERIGRHSGRKIDTANPLLDARLPTGDRVNATLRPPSLDGSTITIRKFMAETLSIIDIIKFGSMSPDLAAFFWVAVEGFKAKPANILVSGGTGSGKTTTLNCIGQFIPFEDRLITIEDTAELQILVPHLIRMETKSPNAEGKGGLGFNELLINTLRMRPERLILGEVRGSEAATLFVAMNTGHDGTMGTCHANNASETIQRLRNAPMNVPLIMLPALDLIIMQNRITYEGQVRRRITEISEVAGVEGDNVLLNKVFEYDPKEDKVNPTGVPSSLMQKIARTRGVTPAEVNTEMQKRELVLQYLLQKDIHKSVDVVPWLQDYMKDPEGTLEKITADLG